MAHYGYRIMKAEWLFSDDMTFIADLRINGIDSGPGVIERVTHQISSQLGLDIRSLNIAGDDGYFEGMIKLKVRNINQLNQVIRALQGMDNVTSVVRVDY
jgi:GTP pyrophosphokinase